MKWSLGTSVNFPPFCRMAAPRMKWLNTTTYTDQTCKNLFERASNKPQEENKMPWEQISSVHSWIHCNSRGGIELSENLSISELHIICNFVNLDNITINWIKNTLKWFNFHSSCQIWWVLDKYQLLLTISGWSFLATKPIFTASKRDIYSFLTIFLIH